MRRRGFSIIALSGVLDAAMARAQQSGAVYQVGVLDPYETADNFNDELRLGFKDAGRHVRFGCAPCKGGAFQWVQAPPGNRSSRKQSEQSWR